MPRPLPPHLQQATGGDVGQIRAHILDAAHRVIVRDGLAGAGTRAIAAEAELGAGTLYNYFDDRDQLISLALLRQAHLLARPLGGLPARAGSGTVLSNLQWFARHAGVVLDAVVPLIGASFSDPDLLARLRLEFAHDDPSSIGSQVILSYLEAEQDLGRVGDNVDCAAAASAIVGLCHDRAFQHFLLGTRHRPIKDAIELISSAITT